MGDIAFHFRTKKTRATELRENRTTGAAVKVCPRSCPHSLGVRARQGAEEVFSVLEDYGEEIFDGPAEVRAALGARQHNLAAARNTRPRMIWRKHTATGTGGGSRASRCCYSRISTAVVKRRKG